VSSLSHRTRRMLWAVIAVSTVAAAVLVFTTKPRLTNQSHQALWEVRA